MKREMRANPACKSVVGWRVRLAVALMVSGAGALQACASVAAQPVTAPSTALPARMVEVIAPGAEMAAIEQVVTAARVAAWGRKTGDPQALILAARLLAEVPFRETGPDGLTGFSPSALLDEAVDLARGDGQTLAEIEAVREAAARGVVNSAFGRGPILAHRDVQARQTYWFEVDARGGEVLRLAAIGDGDTDIDMVVRDGDGRALCEDGQYDHYPVCTLMPGADARLRVEIINRGAVWTRVRILSN